MSKARKIASTIFKSGADDKIDAADIYMERPESQPPKTIREAADKTAAQVGEVFVGEKGINVAIKSIAFGEDGKIGLDKKAFVDQVMAETNNFNTLLTTVKDKTQTAILKAVGFKDEADVLKAVGASGIAGALGVGGAAEGSKSLLTVQNAKVVINNVTTIVDKAKDVKDARDVVSLLNSISGNSTLAKALDMQAQFAVLGTMMERISAFRIPGAIDAILDKIQSDKDKKAFLLENVEKAIRNSDMETVQKTIDVCGAKAIMARVPNAPRLILTFYRFQKTTGAVNFGVLRTQLIGILNTLNVNWHRYSRNGVLISNLEVYTYSAPDALDLLRGHPDHRIAATIAPKYRMVSNMSSLQRKYPRAVFEL